MNVIMPTAMITMHTDAELSQNSAKTAKRGAKIVKALIEKPGMKEQCIAIYNVAKMGSTDGINDDSNNGSSEKDINVSEFLSLSLASLSFI